MKTIKALALGSALVVSGLVCNTTEAQGLYDYHHDEFNGFVGVRVKEAGTSNVWMEVTSTHSVPIPGQNSSFTILEDNTDVAIHFSGDVEVLDGDGLNIRPVIDGVPMHDTILLSQGTNDMGSHAYTWVTKLDRGIHTVWLEGHGFGNNPKSRLRRPTLTTVSGPPNYGMVTESKGDFVFLDSEVWAPIPGLPARDVVALNGDETLVATLSSWLMAPEDSGIQVRMLANGVEMDPGPINWWTSDDANGGAHRGVFSLPASYAGGQGIVTLTPQFRQFGNTQIKTVNSAFRTFTAEVRETDGFASVHRIGGWDQAQITQGSNWSPLLGSGSWISLPQGAEIVAHLTGNVDLKAGDGFYVRMRIDGVPVEETLRTYKNSDDTKSAVSMDFSAKYLNRDGASGDVTVDFEWRSINNNNPKMENFGTVFRAETMAVPDLAENHFSHEGQAGVHPKIVMIFYDQFDPAGYIRPDPQVVAAQISGPHGVNAYLAEVSGGRYQVDDNVDVWGWYHFDDVDETGFAGPWVSGGTTPNLDAQDYVNYPPNDNDCAGYGPYIKAGDMGRAHAYAMAESKGMDVTAYDRDGDGVLEPSEVIFVLVAPAKNGVGSSGWVRETATAYCDGSLLTVSGVDGVKSVKETLGWNLGDVQNHGYATLIHELGHYVFDLRDTYMDNGASSAEPGRMGMMANGVGGERSAHFVAPHKLALGWAEPLLVSRSGNYCIDDVKDSEEVLILPQLFPHGGEYFALTHRKEEVVGSPRFDIKIEDTGLAAWHVIDPDAPGGDVALDVPHPCNPNWGAMYDGENVSRRGQRLLRPNHSMQSHTSFWDDTTGDLVAIETAAAPNCPTQYLEFTNGDADGYRITNITPNGNGTCMDIEVPSCEIRCGSYDPNKVCQCDAQCVNFGDCCFDETLWCN